MNTWRTIVLDERAEKHRHSVLMQKWCAVSKKIKAEIEFDRASEENCQKHKGLLRMAAKQRDLIRPYQEREQKLKILNAWRHEAFA